MGDFGGIDGDRVSRNMKLKGRVARSPGLHPPLLLYFGSGGGTRTPDTRIMIPHVSRRENENDDSKTVPKSGKGPLKSRKN